MNDIQSIIFYGLLGWWIITDLWLIVWGILRFTKGIRTGYPYGSAWLFFLRKIAGVAMAITAVLLYCSGILGFMWSIWFAAIVSLPETLYFIWKDVRAETEAGSA